MSELYMDSAGSILGFFCFFYFPWSFSSPVLPTMGQYPVWQRRSVSVGIWVLGFSSLLALLGRVSFCSGKKYPAAKVGDFYPNDKCSHDSLYTNGRARGD